MFALFLPLSLFQGFFSLQEPASVETAAVEEVDLPDWLPIDSRGEWEHLYTRRLPELQENIHDMESRERGMARLLAEYVETSPADESDVLRLRETLAQLGEDLQRERLERDQIETRLKQLTSFFHWPNPKHWVLHHGPGIGGILLVLLLGLWGIGIAARGVLRRANKADDDDTDAAERLQRAETLVAVFRQTAAVVLVAFCGLALLGELGVNTTALVAGVGLLGLAVSFGSQNLVKDFLSGFFMLLEGQLSLGDVVSIDNKLTGTVEDFHLRVTRLRDSQGVVHFVPNGSIKTVSNLTHGFSKAVFTVGAGYSEDPDDVIAVLEKVLAEFAEDETWVKDILEEPQILGVDSLGESEVAFKISVKVAPGRQWAARREMLKRIKVAFDLEGIEIPFPQRVHYVESNQPQPKTLKRRGSGQS